MKKLFEGKVLTIPNLLSCLRLALIPAFVWTYLVRQDPEATVLLLLISGLSDVADGFIARRFNMVSNLGKVLDPLADKLTQGAMLVCLMSRFPMMLLPFCLMVLKEMVCVGTGLAAIDSTGEVRSAGWHGKLSTVLLYAMLITHVLWAEIPAQLSLGLIMLCAAAIVLSGVLYGLNNLKTIRSRAETPADPVETEQEDAASF